MNGRLDCGVGGPEHHHGWSDTGSRYPQNISILKMKIQKYIRLMGSACRKTYPYSPGISLVVLLGSRKMMV